MRAWVWDGMEGVTASIIPMGRGRCVAGREASSYGRRARIEACFFRILVYIYIYDRAYNVLLLRDSHCVGVDSVV